VHLLVQVPEGWLGGRIEAHQVSCDVGSVSFAVRWHDDRPALLWEVETVGVDEGGITLDASGLDPSWRGTGTRGEALLAPVHMPESSATRGSVIKGLQIGRADGPGRRP
jgi:hypothetical protein